MYVSLENLKMQLKVENDIEDGYILDLEEAAEGAIARTLRVPLATYEDDYGNIPTALRQAIMIATANLYQSRESIAFAQSYSVGKSLDWLLESFIKYDGNIDDVR